MGWKHASSVVKKNFQVQQSVKKDMMTVFWDMEVSLANDFLKTGAIMNNVNSWGKIYLFNDSGMIFSMCETLC